MGEWFHDARPKEEVMGAWRAIAEVKKGIQEYFP